MMPRLSLSEASNAYCDLHNENYKLTCAKTPLKEWKRIKQKKQKKSSVKGEEFFAQLSFLEFF